MDFIEKWFGISPDGGDGSLEALYIAIVILAFLALLIRYRHTLASWFMHYLEQLGKRGDGDRFDP
jgi:hypothetical protein